MATEFEDIRIISMDDTGSYKDDPNSALMWVVLNLSASAPYDWCNYFNQRWSQHIYMMKRNASASGKRLEIYCVPEELQKDHTPELKKIIAETNQEYRQHVARTRQIESARAAAEVAERARLTEIKSGLKFD